MHFTKLSIRSTQGYGIMFLMGNKFSTWINEELDKRDWSQSDLARASGVHRATISKLLSYPDQRPSPDTCTGIAKALSLPVDFVLEKAGLIPESKDKSPTLEEANQLMDELPEEYQKQALNLIRFLHKTYAPNPNNELKTSSG